MNKLQLKVLETKPGPLLVLTMNEISKYLDDAVLKNYEELCYRGYC